jgi:hypothetical protein
MPAFRHLRFQETNSHQRIQYQFGTLLFRKHQVAAFFFKGEIKRSVVNTKSLTGRRRPGLTFGEQNGNETTYHWLNRASCDHARHKNTSASYRQV